MARPSDNRAGDPYDEPGSAASGGSDGILYQVEVDQHTATQIGGPLGTVVFVLTP